MKTLFLTISLFLAVPAAFSQTDSTASTTNTERIIDKYLDKTGSILTGLAEKLRVPAEHVYSILVRQQVVTGITEAIIYAIFLIAFLLSVKPFLRGYKRWDEDGFDNTAQCIWFAISGSLTFIMTLVFCLDGLPRLINPEYFAITKILDLIG